MFASVLCCAVLENLVGDAGVWASSAAIVDNCVLRLSLEYAIGGSSPLNDDAGNESWRGEAVFCGF